MPMRIYALAKELKVDSKALVDICTRAGITGKGSALASLEDDEVARVRAFLASPKPSSKSGAPLREGGLSHPGSIAPSSSVPVGAPTFSVPSPSTPSPAPAASASVSAIPVSSASESPPLVSPASGSIVPGSSGSGSTGLGRFLPARSGPAATTEAPSDPAATSAGGIAPVPSAPTQPPPDSGAFRRDDYLPATTGGKVKVLGAKAKSARPTEGGEKPRVPKVRVPVIHIAQMPEVQQPVAAPKSNEPAPQKPDIRLPQDAIASAKLGARPPLEHLTAKAEKKKKEKEKEREKPREKGAPPASPPADLASRGRIRGKRDKVEGVDSDLAGMASARADRQKAKRPKSPAAGGSDRDDDSFRSHRRRMVKRKGLSTAAPRKGAVAVQLPCTVRSFSEATGVGSGRVLATLLKMGVMLNINAQIEQETAELIAAELGLEVEIRQPVSIEETVLGDIHGREDSPESLEPRPPIVTFLGHVDHGKTSLLDRLVGTNVVAGEAGGITQHIRAYQITAADGRVISFVDTPGHEAFTEMRARGANVTDVAVIVIAADDGIMPQTEEAISHAQAAKVPIVVALNKMDLPGANANRVLTQMTEHGLTPGEWGGDVEVVRTSAVTGAGMDDLLETLLTIAEIHGYRANRGRPAQGVCLEAEQGGSRGVMAKLIVQNGTLRVGDIVVCGESHGRVKFMYDTLRATRRVEEAGPSMPVNVAGFDSPPGAGETFYVLSDITQARELADQRSRRARAANLTGTSTRVSFERFQEMLRDGRLGASTETVTLNLIIRADTRGSIEAIVKELDKLEHPEVRIKVLLKGVGGITVGDVHLAEASDAVIVGFNVTTDEGARQLAEEKSVEVRRYEIIYKLTDDLRAMLEGKLKPEERVVELGRAVVKQVFPISRVGTVAGCYVVQGLIERACRVRVFREGRQIGEYPLDSLKRVKDDVKEVQRGMECGLKLMNFNDIKKDDILEAFKIEEFARTL
ncbi:MAG: translation initiation factor IF-2 [Planctomycetes bacterium]|nr:translation initiation factor IF-2 [Planctomycetota bacterium]